MSSMNHARGRGSGLRGNPSSLVHIRSYRRSSRVYSVGLKERVGDRMLEYGVAWAFPDDGDRWVEVLCRWNGGPWVDPQLLDDAVMAVTEFEDIDDLEDPGRVELRPVPFHSMLGNSWGIEQREDTYVLAALSRHGEVSEIPMEAVIASYYHSTAEGDIAIAARLAEDSATRALAINQLASSLRRTLGGTRVLPTKP